MHQRLTRRCVRDVLVSVASAVRGGAAATVITKGRGNMLHGSAYEYRQGSDVNANDFFNHAKGKKISPYKYNQCGGCEAGLGVRHHAG